MINIGILSQCTQRQALWLGITNVNIIIYKVMGVAGGGEGVLSRLWYGASKEILIGATAT